MGSNFALRTVWTQSEKLYQSNDTVVSQPELLDGHPRLAIGPSLYLPALLRASKPPRALRPQMHQKQNVGEIVKVPAVVDEEG